MGDLARPLPTALPVYDIENPLSFLFNLARPLVRSRFLEAGVVPFVTMENSKSEVRLAMREFAAGPLPLFCPKGFRVAGFRV